MSQSISGTPLTNFFEKGGGLSTAVTNFLTPVELLRLSEVSKIFNARVRNQFSLYIKLTEENQVIENPVSFFSEHPEFRRSYIGCDAKGLRYLQKELSTKVQPYRPATEIDITFTMERIEKIAAHVIAQREKYSAPMLKILSRDQKFALEKFRDFNEVRDLDSAQAKILANRPDITRETVLLLKQRYPGIIPSYVVGGLNLGLSIEQVTQKGFEKWFSAGHIKALEASRTFKEIQDLSSNQAEILAKRWDITRETVMQLQLWYVRIGIAEIPDYVVKGVNLGLSIEQVTQKGFEKWFSVGHIKALEAKRTFKEIQNLDSDQAEILAKRLDVTQEDVIYLKQRYPSRIPYYVVTTGLKLGLSINEVTQSWFTITHLQARRGGRTYEEVRGLSSKQADILFMCPSVTRNDIETGCDQVVTFSNGKYDVQESRALLRLLDRVGLGSFKQYL